MKTSADDTPELHSSNSVSQNVKNTAKTACRLDTDYSTADATPFLVWDNDSSQLRRVYVGPADSGGTGYRVLMSPNK